MHAYLFIGSDVTTRTEAIQRFLETHAISPFDQMSANDTGPHIGISAIRAFISVLSLSPQQSTRNAGIIPEAERLTLEAQTALLKTLEEPPPHAYILLGASNISNLLPTIVSRCTIVRVADTVFEDKTIPIDLESSPGKLIAELSRLGKTKEDYIAVFDQLIQSPKPHLHAALLHRLLRARQYLTNNVHPLLLLEHALLTRYNDISYVKIPR